MITNSLFLNDNREELLIRTFPDFPVSIYQTDFSDPNYQLVNWHWHEDFQLCLVHHGIVCFQTPGARFSVSSGGGIFLNRRLVHSAQPLTPDASYFCINFSPDLFSGTGKALSEHWLLPVLTEQTGACFCFHPGHSEGDFLSEHIRLILRYSELHIPDGWQFLIYSELLSIWPVIFHALQQETGNKTSFQKDFSASNARLKQILSYLQTHYAKKVRLKDIASQVNLCPEECERFFKYMTGLTLFQYLTEYRIKKSQELLSDSRLSIAEIAQSSGFTTQSYYTSCFKRLTGCTPGAYRKQGN